MAKTLLQGASSGNNQSSTIYTVPSNKYAQVTVLSFGNPNGSGYNQGYYNYAPRLRVRYSTTAGWVDLIHGFFPWSGIIKGESSLNWAMFNTGKLVQDGTFMMSPSAQLGVIGAQYSYHHYSIVVEEIAKTTVEA